MSLPPSRLKELVNGLIGERCANLVITHTLGYGGYGAVYIAENRVRTKYAVKCLFKQGLSREQLNIQKQEIFINRRLGHDIKNVVALEDVVESEQHLFLVFEYCSRGDLFDLIRRDGGCGLVDKSMVRDFALQLVAGVQRCHLLGVYHRDIKPENILISEDWVLKLGDFGLATTLPMPNDRECGSPPYMAPELLSREDDLYSAARADVWSMGIVLFNMLLGVNPWDRALASEDVDYASYVAADDRAEYLRHRFNMTNEVAVLMAGVLHPDPLQRFTNQQMYRAVQALTPSTMDPSLSRMRKLSSSLSRSAAAASSTSYQRDSAAQAHQGAASSSSISPNAPFKPAVELPMLTRSFPDRAPRPSPRFATSWAAEDDDDDDDDDLPYDEEEEFVDAATSFSASAMRVPRGRLSDDGFVDSVAVEEDEDEDEHSDAIFEMDFEEEEEKAQKEERAQQMITQRNTMQNASQFASHELDRSPILLSSSSASSAASSVTRAVPNETSVGNLVITREAPPTRASLAASIPSVFASPLLSSSSNDAFTIDKQPIAHSASGPAPTSELATLLQQSMSINAVRTTVGFATPKMTPLGAPPVAEQGDEPSQQLQHQQQRVFGRRVDSFDLSLLPSVANDRMLNELAAQLDSHVVV